MNLSEESIRDFSIIHLSMHLVSQNYIHELSVIATLANAELNHTVPDSVSRSFDT